MIITIRYPDDEIIAEALKLLGEDYPRERLEIVMKEAQDSVDEGIQAITEHMPMIAVFMGKVVAVVAIHGMDSDEAKHAMHTAFEDFMGKMD